MAKYNEMMEKALEMLNSDDELYVDMVNELDGWNGFADGFRAFPMYEIDDLFCDTKVSDFLDMLGRDFNHNDTYFIDTIYGLESCNDIAAHYRDNADPGDVLDNVIENANNLWFSDSDFENLINNIVNYTEDETAA